jgi:hypothetical protein
MSKKAKPAVQARQQQNKAPVSTSQVDRNTLSRKSEMASYNPAPDAASPAAPTGRYWELKITR